MKHIIIKLTKVKDRNCSKRKVNCHKQGKLLKTKSGSRSKNLAGQWRLGWYFQNAEGKKTIILYFISNNTIPKKLSFNHERRIKAVLNTQKLQEFITASPNS